jgi:hypothetical protein
MEEACGVVEGRKEGRKVELDSRLPQKASWPA